MNTTSRHCTTGERGNITLSKETFESLVNDPWFVEEKENKFDERFTEMKGKGKVKTFILNFKRDLKRLRRRQTQVANSKVKNSEEDNLASGHSPQDRLMLQKVYGFKR